MRNAETNSVESACETKKYDKDELGAGRKIEI